MSSPYRSDRPLFFAAVVLVLAAANGFGVFIGLTRKAELLRQFPRLEPIWWLYFACPALTLIGLAALWSYSKWGYELVLLLAAVVLGIELYAMGLAPHLLRIPVAVVLLVAAVHPIRGRLHY